jgi:hypothetical protein
MHCISEYFESSAILYFFFNTEKRDFVYLLSNLTCMKRILLFAAGFVFITLSFTSCQKNCKVCAQNTYDSGGNLITAGTDTEYCDASLLGIEATQPVTVLGVTTKWVCQ